MALRPLCILALLGAMLSPVSHADITTNPSFNEYASGAMEVYQRFKTYDRAESEQFFSFIKNKWERSQCDDSCKKDGYNAGVEYVSTMKVEMESNEI